jgi:hypothetical protein
MTKSLQEIQQENRRLILEAVHGCSYEEALKYCFKTTLSQVLLALPILEWWEVWKEGKSSLLRFSKGDYSVFEWDLDKETLELQKEWTQRQIHNLLSKQNGN